jgi:hypothetical protein
LRNKNIDWENVMTSSQFQLDVSPTPQSKRQIPTPIERIVYSKARKNKRVTMSDKYDKATNESESGGPSQSLDRENS